jgi:type II secretory pathway predicted ATPase ExeA
MYEQFYGLDNKPFLLTPDADLFYLSPHHRAALNMLEYGLQNHAAFMAITGEVGTGKTTLIRRFLSTMDDTITIGVVTNSHRSFGDLMQWVLLAFGLDYKNSDKAELYDIFVEFLISEYAANRRTMLIMDEAQNMDCETLEQLRMLSNVNLRKDLILQIVLVGQPELLHTLKKPELRQFAQRISVDYRLRPLKCKETMGYIRHRICSVGGDAELFDDLACVLIHHFTQGVPRLINIICDTALVYGFAEDKSKIDVMTVMDAVKDKQESGLGVTRLSGSILDLEELVRDLWDVLRPDGEGADPGDRGGPSRANEVERA